MTYMHTWPEWLAIGVASLLVFVIGGAWFAPPVFGRRWMALSGASSDELSRRRMGLVFGGTYLLGLVMTINLALFLGPSPSLAFAVGASAAAGIGWTAAAFGITYLFERRPLALWGINAGYHAVALIAIGAVLAVVPRAARPAASSDVRLTSYTAPDGSRVLRHEVVVDAPPAAVYRAFTTSEGLRGFVAPVASIDARPGGMWEAAYDPNGRLGNPGNILNQVIALVPDRLIAIRIYRTPPGFPHPDVAARIWTTIEMIDEGSGRTRVVTSMYGWESGPEWDQVYTFFERGNALVSRHLRDYVAGRPISRVE
jgi:uncharacterized protein YndB with AHSA1/START domain